MASQMFCVIYLINKNVSWLVYRIESNLMLNQIIFSGELPITDMNVTQIITQLSTFGL